MQEKSKVRVTGEHIRGARAILKWSLEEVAERSGVSKQTVYHLENGLHETRDETRQRVKEAFEQAGIVFTNGDNPGVQLIRVPVGKE